MLPTFEMNERDKELSKSELFNLAEHSMVLAKDQSGCRYLQKKIDEEGKDMIDVVFVNTIGSFMELMRDSFGNYLA